MNSATRAPNLAPIRFLWVDSATSYYIMRENCEKIPSEGGTGGRRRPDEGSPTARLGSSLREPGAVNGMDGGNCCGGRGGGHPQGGGRTGQVQSRCSPCKAAVPSVRGHSAGSAAGVPRVGGVGRAGGRQEHRALEVHLEFPVEARLRGLTWRRRTCGGAGGGEARGRALLHPGRVPTPQVCAWEQHRLPAASRCARTGCPAPRPAVDSAGLCRQVSRHRLLAGAGWRATGGGWVRQAQGYARASDARG